MGAIEMTAVAICAEHGSCELPTFSREPVLLSLSTHSWMKKKCFWRRKVGGSSAEDSKHAEIEDDRFIFIEEESQISIR